MLTCDFVSLVSAPRQAARILLYISYLSTLLRSERRLNSEDHGLKEVPLVVRKRFLELFTHKAEV